MKIFIEATSDGSPTAYFEGFEGERMHHRYGAFAETMYLYAPVVQWAYSKVEHPRILSLGTGLGYNEIISVAFELLFESTCQIDSYEADESLNTAFQNWVFAKAGDTAVPFTVYDTILEKTAQAFEIPAAHIRERLCQKLKDRTWKLNGAFSQPQNSYHAIFYDFFSTKAMASFWTEEYLMQFFKVASAPLCAMATYACTGALKRAVRACGYRFVRRKGFAWKKASSFATLVQPLN